MIFNQLKENMDDWNHKMRERTKNHPSKTQFREVLKNEGTFFKVAPFSKNEVSSYIGKRGIIGVDGSYTTVGNTFPYILYFAQALAKNSLNPNLDIKKSNVFSIFTHAETEIKDEKTFHGESSSKVTEMELSAAFESLHANPFLVMFDGGFWRLSKDVPHLWESYKKESIEKGILSVGIIEDAGSFVLYDRIKERLDIEEFMSDSEILFDVLEFGEVFMLNEPFEQSFYKVFARFSNDPLPIVCDFLMEHQQQIVSLLRFVFSLTPKEGRGIPIWIDIVDKEVKITKKETDLFVDTYLDPIMKEKLFTGKRNRRTL